MLQAEGAKDVVIEMHSLSKTFNMTGWRIGFAVGNKDLIWALNKLKSNLDSRQFPALSLTAGWTLLNAHNQETLDLYKKRRDILVDGLNLLAGKSASRLHRFMSGRRFRRGIPQPSLQR